MFGLSDMTSLILDSNQITSHTVFPPLPKLKILWVNKNKISNLSVFMESVATNFPELKQLCMMNNPAAPSYFNGGSRQEYQDYRCNEWRKGERERGRGRERERESSRRKRYIHGLNVPVEG